MPRLSACMSAAAYVQAIQSGLIHSIDRRIAAILYRSSVPMYQEEIADAIGRGGVKISTVTPAFSKLLKRGAILEHPTSIKNRRTGEDVTGYVFNHHNAPVAPTTRGLGKLWAVARAGSITDLRGPYRDNAERIAGIARGPTPMSGTWILIKVKRGGKLDLG